jgi:hypothetical protein
VPDAAPNAPPVQKGAVSVFILMKPCSPNYVRASKRPKVATSCASELRLSIPSPISVDGKDDAPAIGDYARISSISGDAPSSTICMSWLALTCFLPSFRILLDFSTDALDAQEWLVV